MWKRRGDMEQGDKRRGEEGGGGIFRAKGKGILEQEEEISGMEPLKRRV